MSATALVFGSTGAVGSKILSALLSIPETFPSLETVSRRPPKESSPSLQSHIETDSSQWSTQISALEPHPEVVFNAVGTTRAQAGSIEAQWKIDHDLCIDIAKAAKASGVKTFIYISSFGTRGFITGRAPYCKMKVGVEDAIMGMGFDQAIILRPGFILGDREVPKAPTAEKIVRSLHLVSWGLQDMIGQDQEVIGRAAVAAAKMAVEGKAPQKPVWLMEGGEIVRLGRDEWKS